MKGTWKWEREYFKEESPSIRNFIYLTDLFGNGFHFYDTNILIRSFSGLLLLWLYSVPLGVHWIDSGASHDD